MTADDPRRTREAASMERFVAILFVDIRRSTALFEKRLPYDAVFLLNHYFDAVAGAVVDAGGMPSQFIGDGLMAIFGMRTAPREACVPGARRGDVSWASASTQMNRALAGDLAQPIEIGIGVHAGDAILGEIGYGDRFVLTAIGDAVHVALAAAGCMQGLRVHARRLAGRRRHGRCSTSARTPQHDIRCAAARKAHVASARSAKTAPVRGRVARSVAMLRRA